MQLKSYLNASYVTLDAKAAARCGPALRVKSWRDLRVRDRNDRRFLLGASLAYVHKPHEASRDKAEHLPPHWGKRLLNQLAIGRVKGNLFFSLVLLQRCVRLFP